MDIHSYLAGRNLARAGAIAALLVCSCAVPQALDEARIRKVVSAFLRISPADVKWTRAYQRQGPPNWYNTIVVKLPDPALPPDKTTGAEISLQIHPTSYYVCSAGWSLRSPGVTKATAEATPLVEARAKAEAFAASRFSAWSKNMRLAMRSGSYGDDAALPVYDFRWEDFDGNVRTGTFVRIGYNPLLTYGIYSYAAYIAPKCSASVVKVSEDEAKVAALAAARSDGYQQPVILSAILYLAEPMVEKPHWRVRLAETAHSGAFGYEAFIDAVTGGPLQPRTQ